MRKIPHLEMTTSTPFRFEYAPPEDGVGKRLVEHLANGRANAVVAVERRVKKQCCRDQLPVKRAGNEKGLICHDLLILQVPCFGRTGLSSGNGNVELAECFYVTGCYVGMIVSDEGKGLFAPVDMRLVALSDCLPEFFLAFGQINKLLVNRACREPFIEKRYGESRKATLIGYLKEL